MSRLAPTDLGRVLVAMGNEVVTAAFLAERVGVSERTIYRCVARLRRQGHHILSSSGVGYLLRRHRTRSTPIEIVDIIMNGDRHVQ